MGDSNLAATFGYVARELGRRRIAFLCARESVGPNRLGPGLKKLFGGTYVANEAHTRESAEQLLRAGKPTRLPLGNCLSPTPICRAALP